MVPPALLMLLAMQLLLVLLVSRALQTLQALLLSQQAALQTSLALASMPPQLGPLVLQGPQRLRTRCLARLALLAQQALQEFVERLKNPTLEQLRPRWWL